MNGGLRRREREETRGDTVTVETRTRTSRKLWFGLISVFLGAASLIVATSPEPQAALQEQWAVRVETATIERSSVYPVERAVGRLMPARRATLSFEVPGRVIRRGVEPGMRVVEGQALLQLADDDLRDRLAEAEANYQLEKQAVQRDRDLLGLAERNTDLQRAEVDRLQTLKAKSLTSGSQLDTARQTQIQLQAEQARLRHAVQTAPARLALKKALRDQALRQVARTTLKAPFDGTINVVEVDVGDYVSVQTPVVEIVDSNSLDLYVEVRGEALASLELGQSLTVRVDNRALTGRLHALQVDPDPTTHTHALRVRLPYGQARPGELAAVQLPRTPLENILIVPVSAILNADGDAFVFQYADGNLHRKPVALGPRVGEVQVVHSGVREGDRIVARDVAGLSDGQAAVATAESG